MIDRRSRHLSDSKLQTDDLLNVSLILVCVLFVYHGIAQYSEGRVPSLTWLVVGISLGVAGLLVCVFHIKGRLTIRPPRMSGADVSIVVSTLLICYIWSYFEHIPTGETLGGIIGSFLGFTIASGFSRNPVALPKRHLGSALIGICAFFLVRDCALEIYRMDSNSLAPRIKRGQRVLVNKAAYGLRVPYLSTYAIEWGRASPGDLIVIAEGDEQRPFVRWVLSASSEGAMVTASGWVNRGRFLGSVLAVRDPP